MRIVTFTWLSLFALTASLQASDRWLPEQGAQVSGFAFSPDGKFLATVTDGYLINGELRVWSVADGRERPIKFDQPDNLGISTIAWSPDGQWLATAYWKQVKLQSVGFVALLHVPSGNLINEWKAHDGATDSVAFSADSNVLASAGADGRIRLWDVKTNKLRRVLGGSDDRVNAVTFSGDGKCLAAINADGAVSVWDAAGKTLKFSMNRHAELASANSGKSNCRAIAFSPDCTRLASGDSSGHILVWDIATGRPSEPISVANAEAIRGLVFRPNDNMLAVAAGPTVRLIDPDTGNESQCFGGYSESVYALAFSPDGAYLAIGDRVRVRLRPMAEHDAPLTKHPAEFAETPRDQANSTERQPAESVDVPARQHDQGLWSIGVGAGLLALLFGTIAKVCRRE